MVVFRLAVLKVRIALGKLEGFAGLGYVLRYDGSWGFKRRVGLFFSGKVGDGVRRKEYSQTEARNGRNIFQTTKIVVVTPQKGIVGMVVSGPVHDRLDLSGGLQQSVFLRRNQNKGMGHGILCSLRPRSQRHTMCARLPTRKRQEHRDGTHGLVAYLSRQASDWTVCDHQ